MEDGGGGGSISCKILGVRSEVAGSECGDLDQVKKRMEGREGTSGGRLHRKHCACGWCGRPEVDGECPVKCELQSVPTTLCLTDHLLSSCQRFNEGRGIGSTR